MRLELIAADSNPSGPPEPNSAVEHLRRTGYGHLCFAVEDVEAALRALAAGGVPTFAAAETRNSATRHIARRVGFVKDLEGNLVEFGEPIRGAG